MSSIKIIKIVSFVVVLFILVFGITLAFRLRSRGNTMSSNSTISKVSTIPYAQPSGNSQLSVISSNKWYTSIYNQFPSQPIFAMPLAYEVSSRGLSFSDPNVVNTPNTIFGSYDEDFTVGTTMPLLKPQITQIGDWDIKLSMNNSNGEQLSFFLAHGMPYTIIHSTTQNLTATFTQTPIIVSKNIANTNSLLVTVKSHHYLFVTPSNSNFTLSNNILSFGKVNQVFVALVDNPNNVNIFLKQAQNDLLSTKATFNISGNKLVTTFHIDTSNGSTLTALYPQQYDALNEKVNVLGTYNTIRGPLRLIQTQAFSITIPLTIPPDNFTSLSKAHPDLIAQLNTDINSFISQGPPASKDYGLGIWFGEGASLLQMSDVLNQQQSKEKLLNYLEPIFVQSMSYFTYQQSTNSFIAKDPEYGNEKNNDHHFHYGYYLRTAAVLASYDPTIIPKVKNTVGQMALDIANTDKNSKEYPYLRNMDIYESHSWADGYGDFADGNDEESSSEAVNAWYGVYLWGKVTNNKSLQNTGLILYNLEIQGIRYYWFDVDNVYTQPYSHAIGTILWGGKVDFATWFSADTNMKYGIELLPFTPASGYLGDLPNFSKYANDYNNSGGNIGNPWGDLFVMWQSFYNPQLSLSEINKIGAHEENVPQSLFLYILYENSDKSN